MSTKEKIKSSEKNKKEGLAPLAESEKNLEIKGFGLGKEVTEVKTSIRISTNDPPLKTRDM